MLVLRICLLALIAVPAHADDQELRQLLVVVDIPRLS